MKSFELLLTVLFILIIYLVVIKDMDSNLIMGVSSIWFVILWIGWDNMGAWDDSNKTVKMVQKKLNKMVMKTKKMARKMTESSDSDSDSENNSKKMKKRIKKKMGKKKVRFESDSDSDSESDSNYEAGSELRVVSKASSGNTNNSETKIKPKYNYDIIDELGSNGDNLLSKRMKQMSNKNRESVDNYARQNKMTNMSYFEDELKDHANSIWWDDETLENEF